MAMTFRNATDELLTGISHEKLAKALRVSVPSVRQARLDPSAKAHRSAPEGWESVVADMAESEAKRLLRLSKALQGRIPK